MDTISDKWNLNDVLILRALNKCSAKGGDVRALITCGDYLDHSIFSYEELRSGLSKLLSVEAVIAKKSQFLFSKKFTKKVTEFKRPKKAISESTKFLEILNTFFPLNEAIEIISEAILNPESYNSAKKVYLDSF